MQNRVHIFGYLSNSPIYLYAVVLLMSQSLANSV